MGCIFLGAIVSVPVFVVTHLHFVLLSKELGVVVSVERQYYNQ